MPTHPTAPGASSQELKTRIAGFMRRAEQILTHPLAAYDPIIEVTFMLSKAEHAAAVSEFDLRNVDRLALIGLATLMRPIVFLRNDSISIETLTKRIEREHPGFRGKIKPFRDRFIDWQNTPLSYSGPVGDFTPEVFVNPSAALTTSARTDMHFVNVFFYGELWHSDDDKAAEYEQADEYRRQYIMKCVEVRTLHAIPFIRTLHKWVLEVREIGMDI